MVVEATTVADRASGVAKQASHASRARAGRSRQRESKWAGSTRRCTRTALVTAPFSVWHDPGSRLVQRAASGYFPLRAAGSTNASAAALLRRYDRVMQDATAHHQYMPSGQQ